MRQDLVTPSKQNLTLKSHEKFVVRSDGITLKEHNDLSVFVTFIAGAQGISRKSFDAQNVPAQISKFDAPIPLSNLATHNAYAENEGALLYKEDTHSDGLNSENEE